MPTEREEIQKQTDKILGGAKNFNKSIVSTKNLTVTPLGMSATDLKLIEAKDLDLRDICNAYAVPSNMFNDKSASTESNVKTDLKKFYSDAVIPNNEKILAAFNKMIVPAYSAFENKQLRIVQDTSGIEALQSDQKMKAEKDAIKINNILSIMDSVSLSPEQKTNLLNQMGYEL
jgi:phage portal protein BeeE